MSAPRADPVVSLKFPDLFAVANESAAVDGRVEQFGGPASDDAPPMRGNPTRTVSPLLPMTVEERLTADFHGTGMTVGPHPMAYHRADLKKQGIRSASELLKLRNGMTVRVAGSVIARQRPGTAKGFL